MTKTWDILLEPFVRTVFCAEWKVCYENFRVFETNLLSSILQFSHRLCHLLWHLKSKYLSMLVISLPLDKMFNCSLTLVKSWFWFTWLDWSHFYLQNLHQNHLNLLYKLIWINIASLLVIRSFIHRWIFFSSKFAFLSALSHLTENREFPQQHVATAVAFSSCWCLINYQYNEFHI